MDDRDSSRVSWDSGTVDGHTSVEPSHGLAHISQQQLGSDLVSGHGLLHQDDVLTVLLHEGVVMQPPDGGCRRALTPSLTRRRGGGRCYLWSCRWWPGPCQQWSAGVPHWASCGAGRRTPERRRPSSPDPLVAQEPHIGPSLLHLLLLHLHLLRLLPGGGQTNPWRLAVNSYSATDWVRHPESAEKCWLVWGNCYCYWKDLNISQMKERCFCDRFKSVVIQEESLEVSQAVEGLVMKVAQSVMGEVEGGQWGEASKLKCV